MRGRGVRRTSSRVRLVAVAALLLAGAVLGSCRPSSSAIDDPLPSWNETASKRAITAFVARTTTRGSADYIAPPDRIAVFDNDGTLWGEQPLYFQLQFAIDR